MTPLPHRYPASLARSAHYRATADGVPLDVLRHPAADHLSFECDGPVHIEIEAGAETAAGGAAPPANVVVRPLRHGLQAEVAGNRISFSLPGPCHLQVEVPGRPLLYVYALPPAPPAPAGPGVRRFRGGEVHEAGLIVLGAGETCWIEPGAVVRGSIRAEGVAGVRVGGYGILDGGYWADRGNQRRKAIVLDHCRDSRVEGLLMVSPCHWMIVLGGCEDIAVEGIRQIADDWSSDGIDIAGSRRVRVSGCCLHNGDDNVAIKAIGNTSAKEDRPGAAAPPLPWTGTVEDVRVSGCVFYNTRGGSAMEIGYETHTDRIHDIRFDDCDVLAVHEFGSVFGIHNGDRALVEDVTWEDIRVEHHFDTLIDFRIVKARWNVSPVRGQVRNITLRRIRAVQSIHNPGYTVSLMCGYDAAHPIGPVVLDRFELGGRLIENADQLDLASRHAPDVTFLPGPAAA